MPKLNAQAKLFGVDLTQLGGEVKAAFKQLAVVLRLNRWLPHSAVQVHAMHLASPRFAKVRGQQWLGEQDMQSQQPKQPQGAAAFLLDEQYLLLRRVTLPAMPTQAVADALALEVQTISPFGWEATLWAYRQPHRAGNAAGAASTMQPYDLVLTSQALVAAALTQAGLQGRDDLEVWAQMPDVPLLLPGTAQRPRLRKEQRQLQALLAGGLILAILAAAIAMTPTLQLRARAIDAYQQLQLLAQQTQPQLAQRQQLQSAIEAVDQVREQQIRHVDHIQLLQQLTQALPDDVALQSLMVKQQTLTLQGVSDNASAVLQLLAALPGLKEVRFPSAVTRVPNSAKESFVLNAEIQTAAPNRIDPAAGAVQ